MKLKIVVIDFEIPMRLKKWAIRAGVPAVILTVAAVAWAAPLHTWNTGDTLNATDLNGNFTDLQTATIARPTFPNANMIGFASTPVNGTTTQILMQAGSVTPTLVNGQATITLPAPFPHQGLSVVATYGDTIDVSQATLVAYNATTSTFDVLVEGSTANNVIRVNYIALGW